MRGHVERDLLVLDNLFLARHLRSERRAHADDRPFTLNAARAPAVRLGSTRLPRLHDLRHTAAVNRVENGCRDGKDVQQVLGTWPRTWDT
jgi:integrase